MSTTGHALVRDSLAGVAAGLAGTAVMFALRTFDSKYAPATIARTADDPGHFLVTRAERATGVDLPAKAEQGAILAAHFGYGTTFGLLFALLRAGDFDKAKHPLLSGGLLGVAVWAAGHLGLLPAMGLSKPAWQQSFPEATGELARHAAYGVAVAGVYGAIQNAL